MYSIRLYCKYCPKKKNKYYIIIILVLDCKSTLYVKIVDLIDRFGIKLVSKVIISVKQN